MFVRVDGYKGRCHNLSNIGVNRMKSNVFSVLQRIGRSFMLPIAILPIAGLFLGIGSCLSNEATLATLQLENILGAGTFLHSIIIIMNKVGSAIFTNLPIIFAVSVAIGMAKKEKEVAALSAIIAFLVMHTTINGMLVANGAIVDNQIQSFVLEGSVVSVFGIQSLEMGVFGGIIVGLGVSYLHNRYHRIQLPSVLSFFEGQRFVPIISAIAFVLVGFMMYYLWPILQQSIFVLGGYISYSGYAGTFIYGVIKRLLVPFGLHHVFYLPFWQSAIGGSMMVNDVMIYGGQNIFFAQLADPNTLSFSSEATKYFSGEFIFMMFGLPGAALAMYRCSKTKHKKIVGSLLLSAAFTSILTGITEPIEFSFLFVAPVLFGVQVILAGSAYMIAHMLNITIGLTFSGGLIDFFVFGVMQGNDRTNWILVIVVGILYFFLYYGIFTFLIKRFNLKTPGRDDELDITYYQKRTDAHNEEKEEEYQIDEQAKLVVIGLGGRRNFSELDSCITRIRATIQDTKQVQEAILKQAGAAAIMMQGSGIQIIFGPKASSIKSNVEEYLRNTKGTQDVLQRIPSIVNGQEIRLYNLVDGEILPIEDASDPMYARKLLGDGIIIKPSNSRIVSPCDATISMIYPAKHAIGLTLANGCEILIHIGIDSLSLQEQGLQLCVRLHQHVKQGDLLWKADREEGMCENIVIVFTKVANYYKIEKRCGIIKQGEFIIRLYE